jgi:hypothetical protein
MSKLDHVYLRILEFVTGSPLLSSESSDCVETETVGLQMRDELSRVTGTLTAISVVSFNYTLAVLCNDGMSSKVAWDRFSVFRVTLHHKFLRS